MTALAPKPDQIDAMNTAHHNLSNMSLGIVTWTGGFATETHRNCPCSSQPLIPISNVAPYLLFNCYPSLFLDLHNVTQHWCQHTEQTSSLLSETSFCEPIKWPNQTIAQAWHYKRITRPTCKSVKAPNSIQAISGGHAPLRKVNRNVRIQQF